MDSRYIVNPGPANGRLLMLLVIAALARSADQFAAGQEAGPRMRDGATPHQDREGQREDRPAGRHPESDRAEQAQSTEFLRMRKDKDGNDVALQTAITRYRPDNGEVIVDLIGAVHIGDGEYYRKLNRQFELYDAVLYELVAPQGTRVPAGGAGGSGNPVGMLQQSARRILGLESQLAMIDYQKANFVHADLSPEEMQQKMAERGDSVLTVGLDALTEMIRKQNRAMKEAQEDPDSIVNELANESMFELVGNPKQLKRMMAMQFTSGGGMDLGMGQTLNQVLITDRNEAAMRVLQQQLVNGRKRIAIFYGAAHMADFEQRLIRDFGLQKTDEVWVDAWNLDREIESAGNDPLNMMMQLLNSLDE